MNRLIRVLAFGKETIKAVGRPSLLMWDPDYQGVKVKEVHLRLDAFKQFVQDGIKSTETFLREQLFFGMDLPTVDLKEIEDVMEFIKPWYSFLKESAEKLPDGREFMLNLMKSADSSKQLIDEQGRWDMIKVRGVFEGEEEISEEIDEGYHLKTFKFHFAHLSDVYFSGGQPSRGHELGSIKYRNTENTGRNYIIQNGEGCTIAEYHKAKASTNYSFHVIRYLPESVAILVFLHLVYIRPFAKMLFRNAMSPQQEKTDSAVVARKDPPRSISKQAGRRRVKKRPIRSARSAKVVIEKENETLDRGYIFCSDESPNKCWTGVELSEIQQEESLERLRVKINLWTWRHIIIGITKAHLEEIAPFFSKDEKACKELLETNIYYSIFPWQAGHLVVVRPPTIRKLAFSTI